MDANLYVSDNMSNNAIQEYYDLKRQLTLTKEEQKIYQNYLKERQKTMFDEDLQLKYANYLEPMITAIKHGNESYDDIERFTGINRHNLSVYFGGFYKDLKKENLINPETKKTQKQAVIDFIGSRLLDTNYSESEFAASEEKEKPAHVIASVNPYERSLVSEDRNQRLRSKADDGSERKDLQDSDSVAIQNKKPEKKRFSLVDPLPKPEEKFPLRNEPLMEAEQKVLELLIKGYSYKQCCEELFISDKTIKTHVCNIFSKRGYHSLQDLLVCEYQKKITEIEENQAAAQPPKKLNFSAIKEKIKVKIEKLQTEINKYQEKLTAIDLLETELKEEF